jgi:hypothetical protein
MTLSPIEVIHSQPVIEPPAFGARPSQLEWVSVR